MHANTGIKDHINNNKQQRVSLIKASKLPAQQQQQQSPQQPKQQQKVKKKKPMTPEHQLLINVQAAAKSKNPAAGVAAYHAAVAAGTSIHPDLYSTLLYLCSGGDAWELPLRQQLTESTALIEDIMQTAAANVAAQQEEAATAGVDQQAARGSADASAAGESNAPTQTTSQTAAASGSGPATAVASSSVTGSKSPPADPEMVSANGAMSTAVAGSAPAAEAASLPQLTPSQLREEGRAIFEHMQVRQNLAHLIHMLVYLYAYIFKTLQLVVFRHCFQDASTFGDVKDNSIMGIFADFGPFAVLSGGPCALPLLPSFPLLLIITSPDPR